MEKIEHVNYENMPNDLNSNSASFSRSNFQLNVEEINWLISIISTEDRAKLTKVARDCSSEINFTRGLPLTAAVCGSIYYARNKLPSQYHFGPKGWPMYLLLTFGTMTFTNLFYAGTCNKRIEPVLNDLYQKVNIKLKKFLSMIFSTLPKQLQRTHMMLCVLTIV